MSDQQDSQSNQASDNKATKKKKVKKKGPIRIEAVLPTVLFVVLVYLYFALFFDSNLRSGGEWVGTQIHGAEVNIGKINTSFFRGTFDLYNLQVTNKENPQKNLIQIGHIQFHFLWDALLRAKFVVERSSVENIQIGSTRKSPGKIIPPTPENKSQRELSELEKQVLSQAQEDLNQNIFGDVASILGGTSSGDQLKNIQNELQAEKKIDELQKALKEKEQAWNERLKSLPNQKELDGLVGRAKALKFDSKNPAQFAKDLQELNNIVKEADQKIKLVQSTSQDLNSDIGKFNNEFNQIDDWIQKDIRDLQNRLKIPNLNVKDFSKKLFANMIMSKVAGAKKYMEIAKEYMPPPKTKEEKSAKKEEQKYIPKKRAAGTNFRFPTKKSYPLFWLKQAVISSKSSDSEFSGDLVGELNNVTSDPVHLGKPITGFVKGDFPNQKIFGVDIQLVSDHTTENSYEKITGVIQKFPLSPLKLSNSESAKFIIADASASSQFSALLKDQQLKAQVNNRYAQVQYDVGSNNKELDQILKSIVKDIPVLTLNTTANGSWNHLNLNINSNLGTALSNGFKKQLQKRIDAEKAKIKAIIDSKISGKRKELDQKLASVKNSVNSKVNEAKSQVEGAKKTAENDMNSKKNSAQKAQQDKAKQEGQKVLDDLKKKFKF